MQWHNLYTWIQHALVMNLMNIYIIVARQCTSVHLRFVPLSNVCCPSPQRGKELRSGQARAVWHSPAFIQPTKLQQDVSRLAQKQENGNTEGLCKLGFHVGINLNGFVDQQEQSCVHEHIRGINCRHLPRAHPRLQNGIGCQDQTCQCRLCLHRLHAVLSGFVSKNSHLTISHCLQRQAGA